ncbi:related to HOL1 protein [Cephalotrichum gorgonifer]|uniref:Related to HOL1 protein n=1 Tax=Cephalotrichum gorgonifer TaxID=2041049 RepID=A0AAE8N8H6_9PEZI|nr:related to HOL1 protein [Cephalotrichum gorgonifer]
MAGTHWKDLFQQRRPEGPKPGHDDSNDGPPRWSMGVLNDKSTIEVPGSVLLLASHQNEPLGLHHAPARTVNSSLPTGYDSSRPATPRRSTSYSAAPVPTPRKPEPRTVKKTENGKFILEPQPEDSANDPLNWPTWRRDAALLTVGFYCMVGGGIGPLLAAGFADIGHDYDVEVEEVALTTGMFMMGLGIGSVVASPTAILYGKRPVYLASAVIFVLSCVWCALSPSFPSLIVARIVQGIAVSPVECLPSATIAEIFFLHERAFRIGIYTLLLLGGKNIVPLISAVIIQNLGWRWVFWIITVIVAFWVGMLFLFVPETFWDRSPTPKPRTRPNFIRRLSSRYGDGSNPPPAVGVLDPVVGLDPAAVQSTPPTPRAENIEEDGGSGKDNEPKQTVEFALADEREDGREDDSGAGQSQALRRDRDADTESGIPDVPNASSGGNGYTTTLRHLPARSFRQQLRPYNGRLRPDSWITAMLRPFILYSYPAVLWSSAVYACSVGWLIVISESMAMIYQDKDSYNFTPLQTGLVYISPFIGGLFGTAVAGKVSDIVVKAMARRNGGLYEPEFRLVMAIPILISTVAGLMGFGWSAEERDHWIVPTVFFGIISFGCSLGSTTSITFCVDSYRQYAGEALVTLNFTKNIFHGLVFSLFFTHWLSSDGSRLVFIWTGVIQLVLMLTTVPLFIYGKRARMWTVRKNYVESVFKS